MRETIELLCNILKDNGMSGVEAETLRKAKFDKAEVVSTTFVDRSYCVVVRSNFSWLLVWYQPGCETGERVGTGRYKPVDKWIETRPGDPRRPVHYIRCTLRPYKKFGRIFVVLRQ